VTTNRPRRQAILWALALAVLMPACTGATPKVSPGPSTSTTIAAPTTVTGVELAPSTAEIPPSTGSPNTPTPPTAVPVADLIMSSFPLPAGSRPHDVAPATDGGVWYTAQGSGDLGWLDPATGQTSHVDLGAGSRPHGVIVGPDAAAWVTDGGLNAIVRVEPRTGEVTVYPLPVDRPDANLNTAAFDLDGRLWFTGQNGIYGVLDPADGFMEVFDAPRGRGPYGIAAAPNGDVFYASLAGNYVGAINPDQTVTILEPPTPGQGARRVWPDSSGAVWVSEWNTGQLSRYTPATAVWDTWALPGDAPQAYAVYVDDADVVWVSDFGGNAIHRFDPIAEQFDVFELPHNPGNVRQILGRPGEVWGAESAADQLVVIWRGD